MRLLTRDGGIALARFGALLLLLCPGPPFEGFVGFVSVDLRFDVLADFSSVCDPGAVVDAGAVVFRRGPPDTAWLGPLGVPIFLADGCCCGLVLLAGAELGAAAAAAPPGGLGKDDTLIVLRS